MHIMIDIETMGTTPGSAIVSIGAVAFDAQGLGESFYTAVDLASCTQVGLTIDAATVSWWMRQSDDARAAATPSAAPSLSVALLNFSAWFNSVKGEQVWSHGATFDAPLMDAAYKACLIPSPWAFWNIRDTRTLFELANVKPDRLKGTQHNALVDAIAQAEAAIAAFHKIGIWPRLLALSEADIRDEWINHVNFDPAHGDWKEILAFARAIHALQPADHYGEATELITAPGKESP